MTPEEAIQRLEAVRREAVSAIAGAGAAELVRELEGAYLGRKSLIAGIGRGLRDLPPEARKDVGRASNEVRADIEAAVKARIEELEGEEYGASSDSEGLDVTLPGRRPPAGRPHPLTQVLDEILDTFTGMGFSLAEGPVIETDRYNFEALNFQKDHPARTMHDTFYLESEDGEPLLLRTHTSPMQIRLMESRPPPLYVVVPGVCCRRDEVDANHVAVFTQVEGLAVDEGISFADLKGTLEYFARALFGGHLRVRMHPSYFPFTEPSAEVYVSCFACDGRGCPTCKGEGWIEIMGAGMVHPNVFKAGGYDPEITGFAFGMGVERIAKLKFAVSDLRSFYENDLHFLGAL